MERCGNPACKKSCQTLARGLCHTCYENPAIRVLYPKKKVGRKAGFKFADWHEPTEEELNALIAEQLPTMPKGNGDDLDDNPTAIKRRIAKRNRK